ncbi:MAG: DUF2796 domain-containing protein [Burkholderiales bacterium]|nr:DUF2796 domain-containing protein [Burkholderiales bacterium]
MTRRFIPLALLLAAASAWPQAHQHGVVTLDIAIEPPRLTLLLDAPQDSLVGFEHTPRSAAEKQAAAAALARLRSALWRIDPPLGCALQTVRIEAPVLQGQAAGGEHADVEASYELRCANGMAAMRRIDLGPLLDAFARIQRIEARIVAPGGQFKAELKRPARELSWGR